MDKHKDLTQKPANLKGKGSKLNTQNEDIQKNVTMRKEKNEYAPKKKKNIHKVFTKYTTLTTVVRIIEI